MLGPLLEDRQTDISCEPIELSGPYTGSPVFYTKWRESKLSYLGKEQVLQGGWGKVK